MSGSTNYDWPFVMDNSSNIPFSHKLTGSSSTSFGGSSGFGQKAAFEGFGSTPTQTNPFGSATQPSQPAFESSIFGSSTTPFGASSQPAFGSTEAPAFGATSTPAFGATSTSAFGFGQKAAFGGFGSTPTQTNPFGSATQPSQPAFESSIFGSSTTPFGASSQPAFGSTEAPAFGATSTPAFGATSTSAFGSSGFGQKAAFGGFGSTPTQTNPFGSATQPSQPAFECSIFDSSTTLFGASSQPAFGATNPLKPIARILVYKDKNKSHKEAQWEAIWEAYRLGAKGIQTQPTLCFHHELKTGMPKDPLEDYEWRSYPYQSIYGPW